MLEPETPASGGKPRTAIHLVALALVIGSGLVHGRLTDRWGSSDTMARAIDRMGLVPRSIGDWQGRDEAMDPKQVQRAGIQGYLIRRYRNARDGREVTVMLVCGRPGPISVHTPDVCYRGAGYETSSLPEVVTIGSGTDHANVFRGRFQKTGAAIPESLEILWAWNARGVWETRDNPRVGFAPYPALYKIYLIANPAGVEAISPGTPAIDGEFAVMLLQAINQSLFGKNDVSTESSPKADRLSAP